MRNARLNAMKLVSKVESLNLEDEDESRMAREKAIALAAIDEDPKLAGKPENIKEKMVDGKLRKFFEGLAGLLRDTFLGKRTDEFLEKDGGRAVGVKSGFQEVFNR